MSLTLNEMKQEEILKLAKECGMRFSLVCANPDSCPDDDGCCHKQVREGLNGRFAEIEAFYRAAFNAGLGAEVTAAKLLESQAREKELREIIQAMVSCGDASLEQIRKEMLAMNVTQIPVSNERADIWNASITLHEKAKEILSRPADCSALSEALEREMSDGQGCGDSK